MGRQGEGEIRNKAEEPTATATETAAAAAATAATAVREMHLKFSVAYLSASNYSLVEWRSLCACVSVCLSMSVLQHFKTCIRHTVFKCTCLIKSEREGESESEIYLITASFLLYNFNNI